MEYLHLFVHYLLHLDQYLQQFIQTYGSWTYILLFVVIFCESGVIVTPFLPGDSLLFAAGTLSAITALNVHLLAALLLIAAVIGVTVNYHVGMWLGPKIFSNPNAKILKPHYLSKTHAFYEKYGGKAIIIARFIPVIRTICPFVAGIAHMAYLRFSCFNLIGAIIWIYGLLYLSYCFGNLPIVKNNFAVVIIAIIAISLLPIVIECCRQMLRKEPS